MAAQSSSSGSQSAARDGVTKKHKRKKKKRCGVFEHKGPAHASSVDAPRAALNTDEPQTAYSLGFTPRDARCPAALQKQ